VREKKIIPWPVPPFFALAASGGLRFRDGMNAVLGARLRHQKVVAPLLAER